MSRAFRANSINRTLAVVLVGLAINFACATSTPAQASKEDQRIQKVGRENRIGIGENVWVKTSDGTKLRGHINEIGDDYVVVADTKTGQVTRLKFGQVKQVRTVAEKPFSDPAVWLGITLLPVIIALAVLAKGK
jgi:hypothetical protein